MALIVCVVMGFLAVALGVIAWMAHCEDKYERHQHATRAYQTTIISTRRAPDLVMPIAVDYPRIDEVRNITFQMSDAGASVQRIESRMLNAADLRALKKRNIRFTQSYIDPINKGVTPWV